MISTYHAPCWRYSHLSHWVNTAFPAGNRIGTSKLVRQPGRRYPSASEPDRSELATTCFGPAQRSDFFLILVANSTSRLIASAREGRSVCPRRQSSTRRRNCSDTRI
jgi:hypothetical protein